MSPDTKQTPSSAAGAEESAPTPAGGIPLAPQARRRDHVLAACVGVILTAVTLPTVAAASSFADEGRLALAITCLVVTLASWSAAQALFAARSSLGGVVAGVAALAAQCLVLVKPQLGETGAASFVGAQAIIPSGTPLIISALLVGGTWGMRKARSAGRAEARLSMRLGANDRTVGKTPSAPPSRRRDHVTSFPYTLAAVVLALFLLQQGYAELVTAAEGAGWTGPVSAYVLLVLGAAFTGRSTLGARAVGPLLVLTGLPAFLGAVRPGLPGQALLARWLPDDPTGMSLIATGLLLMSLGWGAHLARRQGRTAELAALRAQSPPTPAGGIQSPGA